jgi:hypothetical protein
MECPCVQRNGFTDAKDPVGRSLGGRDFAFFANETSPFRKINRVNAHPLVVRVRQCHAHGVALHHVADTRRDGPQEIAKLQIRDAGVVQVQQELQALIVAPQFLVGGPRQFVRVGHIGRLRRLRRDLGGWMIHAILQMQFTAIRDRPRLSPASGFCILVVGPTYADVRISLPKMRQEL